MSCPRSDGLLLAIHDPDPEHPITSEDRHHFMTCAECRDAVEGATWAVELLKTSPAEPPADLVGRTVARAVPGVVIHDSTAPALRPSVPVPFVRWLVAGVRMSSLALAAGVILSCVFWRAPEQATNLAELDSDRALVELENEAQALGRAQEPAPRMVESEPEGLAETRPAPVDLLATIRRCREIQEESSPPDLGPFDGEERI